MKVLLLLITVVLATQSTYANDNRSMPPGYNNQSTSQQSRAPRRQPICAEQTDADGSNDCYARRPVHQ